jgi:hypothetical protein
MIKDVGVEKLALQKSAKIDRVRMPYKLFVGVAWTFSISKLDLFFLDFEFFNTHGRYRSLVSCRLA